VIFFSTNECCFWRENELHEKAEGRKITKSLSIRFLTVSERMYKEGGIRWVVYLKEGVIGGVRQKQP